MNYIWLIFLATLINKNVGVHVARGVQCLDQDVDQGMPMILGHSSSQFITKCHIGEDLFWVYAMDAACQAVMLLMLEIKPSYPNSILAPASFI